MPWPNYTPLELALMQDYTYTPVNPEGSPAPNDWSRPRNPPIESGGESGQGAPTGFSSVTGIGNLTAGQALSAALAGGREGVSGFALNSLGANPSFSIGPANISVNTGAKAAISGLGGMFGSLANTALGAVLGLANAAERSGPKQTEPLGPARPKGGVDEEDPNDPEGNAAAQAAVEAAQANAEANAAAQAESDAAQGGQASTDTTAGDASSGTGPGGSGTGGEAGEGMEEGGPVNKGRRGRDKVPAMLTRGEYVIDEDSTRRFLPLLQALNAWEER